MRARVKATDPRERQVDRVSRFEFASTRPNEAEYYRHGGILQYVLRQLRNKP